MYKLYGNNLIYVKILEGKMDRNKWRNRQKHDHRDFSTPSSVIDRKLAQKFQLEFTHTVLLH